MTELKLPTDSDSYVNARTYYFKNSTICMLPDCGYEEQVIVPFHRWLLSQHAVVSQDLRDPLKQYGVDSYGVAVGVDTLEFDTEFNMMLFALKWS